MASDFADVLKRENQAEWAFYQSDPEAYKALWSHGDDVTLFAAVGASKIGWAEVSKTFDSVSARFKDGVVTLDYEVVYEGTDVAYTVGYEHGKVHLDGGPVQEIEIRVTQIYRRQNGDWKLVHRHGDVPLTAGRDGLTTDGDARRER